MTDTARKQVEELIDKAAKASHSHEALHYSQAALNAANAICSLGAAEKNAK